MSHGIVYIVDDDIGMFRLLREMIASIGSGQLIARNGKYRMFPILGTGLMSAGFLYLTFLRYDSPFLFVAGGMLLIGLGLGHARDHFGGFFRRHHDPDGGNADEIVKARFV